ncbi:MAG: phenylalanine--tRNA ligase subunit beta [Thermoplasmata archaeon]|nr:MAG: phenylalanine--tRNA ligase subunit beta [Thermoplasmata archaeon]
MGIMVLDLDLKPGTPLEGLLGEEDVILDIEITPNRPDLLCHLGIAREISAIYGKTLKYPEVFELKDDEDIFNLSIENGEDCARYTAAFIENVKIAPSPEWMQKLLLSAGMKPINNIVDVTNFVLLELGQPLHAFDRDTLEGDSIVVRRARKEEKIQTLDEIERELDEEILVIADASKPIALAGVMGGLETEVTSSTTRVVLESASFNRKLIRTTSKRFKLETEASYRFERECDPGITKLAVERACYLIKEIGAGDPVVVCRDLNMRPELLKEKVIELRVKQVNRLLGTHLDGNDVRELLEKLELKADVKKGGHVRVTIPTFRRDLNEEVDLIEEIARTYGYDNISSEKSGRTNVFSSQSVEEKRYEEICTFLASRGFAEVITTSFMDPSDLEKFGWKEDDPRNGPIKIANPLTEAQSLLRTSLLPGLLNVVRQNSPTEVEGLKIFEIGKVFIAHNDNKLGSLPDEEVHLTAVFARSAIPLQWIEKQRDFDFFDLKGEFEAILEMVGVIGDISFQRLDENEYIFGWFVEGEKIAEGGLIPSRITRAFDLEDRVFFFDLFIDKLERVVPYSKSYSPIIPYPPIKRDLCIVVDENVSFSELERVIRQETKFLDSIRLFDYYRGGHLGEGKRSYTVRLSFRSEKGTMGSEEVDNIVEKLLDVLRDRFQARLRGN